MPGSRLEWTSEKRKRAAKTKRGSSKGQRAALSLQPSRGISRSFCFDPLPYSLGAWNRLMGSLCGCVGVGGGGGWWGRRLSSLFSFLLPFPFRRLSTPCYAVYQMVAVALTLNVHHAFLYISLPSLRDYNVKMPKFTFNGGREHKTTIFVFTNKNSPF